MFAKRGLYKPAQVKRATPKTARKKALSQGRLIIDRSISPANDNSARSHKIDADNTSVTDVHHQGSTSSATKALRDLSSLSEVVTQVETDPRRVAPHASVQKSPEISRPSHCLDLSDTESETVKSAKEVLVVDASYITEENTGEIDVYLEYKTSPAKVIRCTPDKFQSDPRVSGSHVTVDTIPKINITDDPKYHDSQGESDRNKDLENITTQEQKQLKEILEDDSLRNIIDPAQDKCPDRENQPTSSLTKNIMQDQHSDLSSDQSAQASPLESTKSSHVRQAGSRNVSNQSMNTSVNQKKRVGCHASQRTQPLDERSRTQPKIKSAALSTSALKAKRKGHVMPSRYMQTVKKGPMKATEKISVTDSSSVRNTERASTTRLSKSQISSKKTRTSTSVSLNETPEVKSFSGKASTPITDNSQFQPPDGMDVSEIMCNLASNTSQMQHSSHTRNSMSSTSNKAHKLPRNLSLCSESMDRKESHSITQKELDILYARYIQLAFLDSRANRVHREQEKAVMEQLYALSLENDKKRKEIQELDRQIIEVKHTTLLDSMIETQLAGLTPVTENLTQVRRQHHELAEALDTTRHFLPTKNIIVPEDDEQALKTLLPVLLETEELLGEINAVTKPTQTTISSLAQMIQELEKTLTSEIQQLVRLNEIKVAMATLVTKEAALYIHELQDAENT